MAPEEATGLLRRVYEEIRARRGKIANIHKALSLRPQAMKEHLDLYLAIMYPRVGEPRLSRAEREAIAVVVSAANGCGYCVAHHKEAFLSIVGDRELAEALAADYRRAGLDERLKSILEFSVKLTRSPWDLGAETFKYSEL